MKRGGFIRRRTPLRQVNPERRARLRAAQFGKQAALCRTLRCLVNGCGGSCDPHHEPTRGAGGLDADTVPLCRKHHDERHDVGLVTFEKRHGLALISEALRLSQSLS